MECSKNNLPVAEMPKYINTQQPENINSNFIGRLQHQKTTNKHEIVENKKNHKQFQFIHGEKVIFKKKIRKIKNSFMRVRYSYIRVLPN